MFSKTGIVKTILIAAIFSISGCKKEAEDSKPASNPIQGPDTSTPLTPAAPGTIRVRINGYEKNTIDNTTDAQTTSIVNMEISGVTEKNEMISLVLPTINKPGNYDSVTVGRYMVIAGNNLNELVWTAPSANLTVTKFDMVERKISGTFSFQAIPALNSNAIGMRVFTEGTFTDVHIR